MASPTDSHAAAGVGFVLAFHTAIVAAGQSAPVLAPLAAADVGASPESVGYFTAIVFGTALISANGIAGLVARLGSFAGAALALAIAAAGLAALGLAQSVAAVCLGAVLIGIGYGPVNPIGSRLLIRVSPPHRRNLIFSLKQSGVAIGGAIAAVALPALAGAFGWRAAMGGAILFTLAIALLAAPIRASLGDDAEPGASIRFRGPFAVGAELLWAPALRPMAVAVFTFSMAQFGFMSVYVTFLWSRLGLAPKTAAALLSVLLVGSILGRLFWGWRADSGRPQRVLLALAWSGALLILATLFMSADWPLPLAALLSLALGLGPMSWSGVLLSEVARLGAQDGGAEGAHRATAGTMVFAYLGGLLGPALLSASSAATGSYSIGIGGMAALLAATALVLAGRKEI